MRNLTLQMPYRNVLFVAARLEIFPLVYNRRHSRRPKGKAQFSPMSRNMRSVTRRMGELRGGFNEFRRCAHLSSEQASIYRVLLKDGPKRDFTGGAVKKTSILRGAKSSTVEM